MEPAEQHALRIEVEAAGELNYAMVHNAVPLIQRIAVSNPNGEVLHELEVSVALRPGVSEPWSARIDELPAGGTYHLDEVDLPLDRERLVNATERERAQLAVEVRCNGAVRSATAVDVDLLAYNEWSAVSVPQLLAAFVLPNHPVVAETLALARSLLEKRTGDPAFNGYQSGSTERVRSQVGAIYEALQRLDITYVNPPASFETSGQKIRTPEQILANRMGTCLDLSVFLAACMEQAGLFPLIFMVEGHAFPGVWLVEHDIPEAASDDGIRFRKLIELDTLLAFDSSSVATRPLVAFDQAQRVGSRYLYDTESFRYGVDVHAARLQRFLPLPARLDRRAFEVAASSPPDARPEDPAARDARATILTRAKAAASRPPVPEPAKEPAPTIPRIEVWKRKLLDLTLRNRLLNFRETKQSARLSCSDLARFEDMLADSKQFHLMPKPSMLSEADPRSRTQLEARTQEDVEKEFFDHWLGKGVLYTNLSGDELGKRLVSIYRAARESMQETGSNTLCIALGFLSWFESDSSEKQRLAPLILIPATLMRQSAGDAFQLTSSDDEIRINTTLLEKLHNDQGVSIPELKELPLDESGVDVPQILALFRRAVANLRRWEVLELAYLGHFSFTKFLMWNDLQQKAGSLMETEVVRHLALGASESFPDQALVQAGDVDVVARPQELLCPMDADSSQQSAILSASAGKTFVLQGPPGTGKSQTITNLIAQCLSQGKRVLFVSEKMAALEVVHRRLSQIGLGPYCLELHSHKAQKKRVIEELGRAMHAQRLLEPPGWESEADKLGQQRDYLNGYTDALHVKRGLGVSLFQGLARLIGLRNAPRVTLDLGKVDDPDVHEGLRDVAEGYASAAARVEPVAGNPWRHTMPPAFELSTGDRVEALARELQQRTSDVVSCAQRLGNELKLATVPQSLRGLRSLADAGDLVAEPRRPGPMLLDEPDWNAVENAAVSLVAVGRERDGKRDALAARYRDGLFRLDLTTLATRLRRWSSSFFLLAWWMLRGVRKSMRGVVRDGKLAKNPELLEDVNAALTVQEDEEKLVASATIGERLFGSKWLLPQHDWDDLATTVDWTGKFRAALQALGLAGPASKALEQLAQSGSAGTAQAAARLREAMDRMAETQRALQPLLGLDEVSAFGREDDDQFLDRVLACSKQWTGSVGRLRDWHHYVRCRRAARKHGMAPLVTSLEAGEFPAAQLVSAFDRALYDAWTNRTISGDAALRDFYGEEHTRQVARFAEMDRHLMNVTRAVAMARISARIPQPGAQTSDSSEMGILLRELKKQRRHLAIRVLFQRIPNLLKRLKPCLLMSPLSVAQYLDPAEENFDIVVFDEASQIPTHDAIGALARGDKAVVVGDSKQLPPTSFFQQSDNPDAEPDEDEFDELESILDECVAAMIPEKSLDWHYRSRHESLIAFSNYHYYKNRLNTFPSAAEHVAHLGVSMQLLQGHYDRGKTRTNRAEARAIVDEVVRRLLDAEESQRSIGVVTFSKAQQTLVEDLLDQARREHKQIEKYFDDSQVLEPVIIKNLENIQGDERDIMLFSICYGPDMTGKIVMSFGPLNRDGGERRLNVAITRARERLIVYSTLRADQIDLSRTNSVGVRHLKTFLDYAQRGPVAIAEALTVEGEALFDSPFEEEVHDLLTARGWNVRTQVGCAGYRIDLGVLHPDEPGRFVLGIECDGAYYHSAKSARDRDRLRGQVLESLGWRLHRIWSTDWWIDPNGQVEKAEAAIRDALENLKAMPRAESNAVELQVEPDDAYPNAGGSTSVAAEPTAAYASGGAAAAPVAAPPPVPIGTPYRVTAIRGGTRDSEACYDRRYDREFLSLVANVIRREAPISTKLLARRIAPYWSVQRATSRFEKRVLAIAWMDDPRDRPQIIDGFAWRSGQSPDQYSDIRVPDGADEATRRSAAEIPLEELANAARKVLEANLAMDRDDLAREAARVFGITRMRGRVASRMGDAVDHLIQSGGARADGAQITLP